MYVKRIGKYPINLRIRVGNKESKLPSNLGIEEDKWDAKNVNQSIKHC
ncbi:hypothetical protein [Proteiniphilum sp.]|nr:hypothetical protein [Proteiniphilum sp.]